MRAYTLVRPGFGALCGLLLAATSAQSLHAAAPATPQGVIRAKAFLNIGGGTAIADLTGNVKFPNSPDAVYYYPYFEFNAASNGAGGFDIATPANNAYGDNYGAQMQGYFYPPTTGDYVFYLSADDNANLYLSTDDDPINRKLIAQEGGWSNARSWDVIGGTPSTVEAKNSSTFATTEWPTKGPEGGAKITLTAGRAYYIEATVKEGGGGDNLAVAVADPGAAIDAALPIPGQYLSPFGVPANAAILSHPVSRTGLAGSSVSFSIGMELPPGVTLTKIEWTKNGTVIPGATGTTATFVAAAEDDNAKIKATVTTSVGALTSNEATLRVASLTGEFTAGVVKFEAYTGITGTAVEGLVTDPKYPGSPDETRLLPAINTPSGYADNYGARVSGFLIPPETGEYHFFLSSDDASQLWISTDANAANLAMVAEETGCCAAFQEPEVGDPATTASPIAMTAGRRYYFEALVKEGGGGDYLQVAVRKVGNTTPAASLQPISGAWIGANAKPNLGAPEITVQPTAPSSTIQGTSLTLNVDGLVTPAGFNFPLFVQWEKDGAALSGATGKSLELANAQLNQSGQYRAVVSAPSGNSVTSIVVTVNVIADTFSPKVTKVKASSVQNMIVSFDEPLDKASAETASNYQLSDGVTVTSATLSGNSVLLVTSGLTVKKSYVLTAGGVKDLFGNTLTAGTTFGFTANVITYADVILADKPIGFYRFEETSGQITKNLGTLGAVADGLYKQGGGEDDSAPADAAVAAGPRPGGFLGFDPANMAVEMKGAETQLWVDTQQQMLNGLQAFTLEYWVKPANRKSDPTAFGTRIGLVGQNDAVEYGFINPTTIQIWSSGGGSLDTTYTFEDNEWHHIATIADGKTIKNYFDGKLVGTGGSTTANYGSSTFNVHIGGGGVYDATGNFFTGQFDEVAVFNKAISAERVAAHYKAGKEGGEAADDGGLASLKIAWVSFHPAENTPAADAATAGMTEASDSQYTKLLTGAGHQVTRFVTTGNPDVATMNTFNLVIISRSVPSGDYQDAPETLAWNGLKAPTMLLGGYILRNSRLGYTTGATIPDTANPVKLSIKDAAHPIFSGVALGAGSVTVNDYAGIVTFNDALQRGISVNTDPLAGGGKVLATAYAEGDPAHNGTLIAEWPAGAKLGNAAADTLGGPRLVFLTGSREADGSTSQISGIYDLTDDGATMFLNAVKYMGKPVASAPTLSISRDATGLKVAYTGTLQGADAITGPWTDVAGASSPYTLPTSGGQKFLRSKQ
ncbi:MAG: Ig-like domain-containing protein [Verrucomicrobiales bacterium]|nr:Ig-like domain-containing protein [Verrucomicrobiales bacterium]